MRLEPFRLRLWHRLFIAFAALSAGALLGFLAWQQHAFRSSFVDYLDDVALARLAPAANRLAAAYADHGNWDFLREAPRRLGDYIETERRPPHDEFDRPPPPPDGDAPPPDAGPRDEGSRDDAPRNRGRGGRPPPGPPDLMPRVLLVDADGARVAGNPNVRADAPAVDISIGDKVVGQLRLAREPGLGGAIDSAFARAQTRDALIAGLAILCAALLCAFALAQRLLAPVRALADGTRALADGDYERRVDATRSDELGDLAGDFNHLAATLERNREARRQWGADIAHELRTPLSVLRGEVQALQDGVRMPTAAAFDSLQAECERLGGLVEDLYQLALADAGALEYRYETVDFALIVREAAAMQAAACMDLRVALDVRTPESLRVRGDERRLAQLIDNLLANSRRHTDAPGRIQLALAAYNAHARLVVDDTTPGVPADALPKLFERLYRVEGSRTRAHGGAGLGLAICRAIVDAHGGRIDAYSSPLGGLRIVVELPLVAEGTA